ncbi:MAG TPA: glucose 1-dehydrogenase [Candidatus Acidoferrum sp.]|nr:glucose 1-dehydrogenase [Candidatus Acidoferrum sp.]
MSPRLGHDLRQTSSNGEEFVSTVEIRNGTSQYRASFLNHMKAVAVNPRKRAVGVITDHPAPSISSPTEVKFRILEVGICGTDREICRFDYGNPPGGFEHLVLGHEGLGVVTEVGPGVKSLKVGDLVVPMVRRPCPHEHCLPCRDDRSDFCTTGDFVERGIKERHGFMTENVVDEERYLTYVPPELRDVAVLMEPLTVAEKALIELQHIQGRLNWNCPATGKERHYCHKAVVLGAGPIGILGAMAFKVAGFDTYVYSRSKKPNRKAQVVESFGVPYISSEEVTPKQLAERLGNIDVVYEGVGGAKIAFEVLQVLGMNGVFIFTGIPGFPLPHLSLDAEFIMRNMVLKNQVALGTVNAGPDAFAAAIRDLGVFMERWPDAIRSVITGRHKLENAKDLLIGKPEGIKNVLAFS